MEIICLSMSWFANFFKSVLDAIPLADVEDVLEKAHNILDDLWRHDPPYSKNRTAHLMELIGKQNYVV